MKELAKSVNSFSWALALFGARQMMNLVEPARARDAFASMTRTAEGHLDENLRATFRMGDRLQRSMVEAGFSLMRVGCLDPAAWPEQARQALDEATGRLRDDGCCGGGR